MTPKDPEKKRWDIILLHSRKDRHFGSELESILSSLGLSVWKFESDGKPSPSEEDACDNIDLVKCVVIIFSEHSVCDCILHRLAHESLNRSNLLPIKLDDSTIPNEFAEVQIQEVRTLNRWDSIPDEGLYKFLDLLKTTTEKDFQLVLPSHEHNKYVSQIYVKVDGQAYFYHGIGTTTWLQSEAFQRQQEAERKIHQASESELKQRHFVPEAKIIPTKPMSETLPLSSPGGNSQPKLFLSYSRKNGEVVDRLDTIFRILHLPVWWDERISAGEHWEERIKENLHTAECVLVIWSFFSVTSNWVLLEAHEGYKRDVLFNLKIDDCAIPEPFAQVETFDFSGKVNAITINDVLTRELLRRIGEISKSDFWVRFESSDHGIVPSPKS